ncbi:MAG: tetratricopeptide repeat protein [Bacteroidota bacterium]
MRYRYLALLLFPLIFSVLANGQSAAAETHLGRADQLYLNGDYSGAKEEYLKIINSGYESAALYYNTGNSCYKLGQIPSAILFYERALLISPRDEDIRFNLNLANQLVIDKINPISEFFVKRWIKSLASSSSVNTWAIMSLIVFVLLACVVVIFFATRGSKYRQLLITAGIVMILLWITSFTFTVLQDQRINHGNYAIVFAPTITAKSSPDNGGTDLFVLHEGLKIKITDQVGTWIRIRLADGNEAWIPSGTVEKI